jgi:GNAT superfamily N-acetyltransferase
MRILGECRTDWRRRFDPDMPHNLILSSALLGRCPTHAFVDRDHAPTQLVVRTHGGKTFASTDISESFLHQALDRAVRLGWTSLIDSGVPKSVLDRGELVPRLRFDRFDIKSRSLSELRDRLPAPFVVASLNRTRLADCDHGKRELPKYYGDRLAEYFEFGYGICLMAGDTVAAEAYAGYVADGRIEVIVSTREALRGQGLASMAAAFLAAEASKRGHDLTWNCHADNVGSVKVARRLPFRRERAYREIYL